MAKMKKNFFIPEWIQGLLDVEREKPGIIAAAAIWDFSQKKNQDKVKILKAYRAKELDVAYSAAGVVDAAEDDTRGEIGISDHRRLKSG